MARKNKSPNVKMQLLKYLKMYPVTYNTSQCPQQQLLKDN